MSSASRRASPFDPKIFRDIHVQVGRLGDINLDCEVGINDLLLLLGAWGPCDDCDNCPADLDQDCTVGIVDLLTLLGNWG